MSDPVTLFKTPTWSGYTLHRERTCHALKQVEKGRVTEKPASAYRGRGVRAADARGAGRRPTPRGGCTDAMTGDDLREDLRERLAEVEEAIEAGEAGPTMEVVIEDTVVERADEPETLRDLPVGGPEDTDLRVIASRTETIEVPVGRVPEGRRRG